MKLLFPQCMDCDYGLECYSEDFERCPKIEKAAEGLGVPYKPKDMLLAENIPFGVYVGLKHLLEKTKKMKRITDKLHDMPEMKYPRMEFVKKLATETSLTHDEASVLVAEIGLYGNIKDAIEGYEACGLKALKLYLACRKAILRNGVD